MPFVSRTWTQRYPFTIVDGPLRTLTTVKRATVSMIVEFGSIVERIRALAAPTTAFKPAVGVKLDSVT